MRFVLFFRRELMQRVEIFDFTLQFVEWINQRAHPRDFIDIGLGTLAVVPKIGRRHPRLERGQFFLQVGQVKETSAARARAISNLRRQRWKFQLAWGNNSGAFQFVMSSEVETSVVAVVVPTTELKNRRSPRRAPLQLHAREHAGSSPAARRDFSQVRSAAVLRDVQYASPEKTLGECENPSPIG